MNWSPIYSFLLSEKIYGYCNESVLVNCTWVFQRLKVSNLQKSFFQVFCQVRGKGGGKEIIANERSCFHHKICSDEGCLFIHLNADFAHKILFSHLL